jgi:hypothetical protein
MCDYSLHHPASRPARLEDKLVVTKNFEILSHAALRLSVSRMLPSVCCLARKLRSTRMSSAGHTLVALAVLFGLQLVVGGMFPTKRPRRRRPSAGMSE